MNVYFFYVNFLNMYVCFIVEDNYYFCVFEFLMSNLFLYLMINLVFVVEILIFLFNMI